MTWQDMTQEELDAAYDQTVHAPNHEQVLARLADRSAKVRDILGDPLRFRYGDRAIESLDVYPAGIDNSPILIFIHGGTWRFGVAADNAFAADMYVNAGINFVVPDFSSVEDFDGSLEALVAQLQQAVKWVFVHAAEFGGDASRIYLAGFSSGAHLAGVLLTCDWSALSLPQDIFKAALLCSGMYDLTPVAHTWRSDYVSLGPDNIPRLSPQAHPEKFSMPLTVAYGTHESPEFQRQARDFARTLETAGQDIRVLVGEGYNHFEIIETLGNPDGVIGREMLRLIRSPG